MAKKKITVLVEEMLGNFLEDNGLTLYHCEFVKEGRDWFLRVFIDKAEECVSTEDCEKVSRFLSAKLDEADPIEQNYYLEVSSPGLDRILYEAKDFDRFKGSLVEVSLYKSQKGSKVFEGELIGLCQGVITIKDKNDNELKFPAEQVAVTRLAVVF